MRRKNDYFTLHGLDIECRRFPLSLLIRYYLMEKLTKMLDKGVLISTNLTFVDLRRNKTMLKFINKLGANDEKHKKRRPKI